MAPSWSWTLNSINGAQGRGSVAKAALTKSRRPPGPELHPGALEGLRVSLAWIRRQHIPNSRMIWRSSQRLQPVRNIRRWLPAGNTRRRERARLQLESTRCHDSVSVGKIGFKKRSWHVSLLGNDPRVRANLAYLRDLGWALSRKMFR